MKFLLELLRKTSPTSPDVRTHREWDRQRNRAMSPNERSEIDAIFSRNV